jgi:hypothetical protein
MKIKETWKDEKNKTNSGSTIEETVKLVSKLVFSLN